MSPGSHKITPVRVAIVDDTRSIVSTIRSYMEYDRNTRVVLTAGSAEEFLSLVKACPDSDFPDVVITDINMPGMDGIGLIRRGKAMYPNLKFLVLTVHDDESKLFDAITAGASGYLTKDDHIAIIADRVVKLAHDDDPPMSPGIARKALDLLARSGEPEEKSTDTLATFNLSTREKEVLELLVKGCEYRDIADAMYISPHTVRKHIANIYSKLHISSKAQAIHLVQSVQNASGARPPEPNGARWKLALVDDHQMILDSLSMLIGTVAGVVVEGTLSDSRNVIPFLRDHKVDLLISDISMPHLDGLELAACVKKEFPQMKILMLTVSENPDQIERAKKLGVNGYILKKAKKQELTQAITQVLSGEQFYQAWV